MSASRFRRVSLAMLWLAPIPACTVGPEYRAPMPLSGPATDRFVAAGPHTTEVETPDDWWRLYRLPALDALVLQALEANIDLRAASANLARARAILEETRAGLFPSTTLTVGAAYGISGSELAAAGAARRSPSPSKSLEAGLDVSWELDAFGRVRRAIEAARADADSVEAARDVVRVSVAAETARAFVDACAYAAAAIVQRRSLEAAERSVTLTRSQAAAGTVADYEVSRAQALAAQTRAVVSPLDASRAGALFRLAVLTGQPPETRIEAAERCRDVPVLAEPIPIGDGRSLLARRPDVREAERILAAATARIGVATAGLYPTITLGASVTSVASTFAGLGSPGYRTWSLGPLLAWSFPNDSAARAGIRAANATAQIALAAFDKSVLQALSDVEQALANEAAELARRAALERARVFDARALAIAEARFNAGAISFLELLDVQRTLIADDNALALSAQVLAADQVLLFKALGGGWRQDFASALPSR